MRYFLEIAYNGKNYFGWQRQPNQISVQEVLEATMSTLLRREIKIVGAGRTDTGVHANQLFGHFDYDKIECEKDFIFRMNSFLPNDIAVKNVYPVKKDAHARFDALRREYHYIVTLGKDPFTTDFSYQLYQEPNIDLMNQASKLLLNHKDFQCFSRSKTDVKTYNCKVYTAMWERNQNKLIFTIVADRFLRNMVRAVVGTLLNVGFGKTSLEEFKEILHGKNREKAGASAPAKGLYLTRIAYPEELFIKD